MDAVERRTPIRRLENVLPVRADLEIGLPNAQSKLPIINHKSKMSFAAFHFAEPRWLWLAAAAPVLLAWLHWHAARARRGQLARMASPHFARELTASHSPARRHFKNALLLAALALAGLALARPQWGSVETANAWLGEDVVFVLDC